MRRQALALALLAATGPMSHAQDRPALELFTRPEKGHCIACHQLPAGVGTATRSDLGPVLAGSRMRELGKSKLRELLQDPTTANPSTVMPPYGRHRILDAREIDRLADFLHALP